jgi:uncharacterized protein (TIGR02270 family)
MRIAAAVIRQHVELAASLWVQRDRLSQEHPSDAAIVKGVEARLEANLDALAIAGDAAWPFIIEQYDASPGKGELFVAAVHALSRRDAALIDRVVNVARGPNQHEGLLGAIAWLPAPTLAKTVRSWMASADGFCRYLAASAYLTHGVDPGRQLSVFLDDRDGRVRAQAYRIAGRSKRIDVLERVRAGLADGDAEARVSAALACAEMGDARSALARLKDIVTTHPTHAATALRWALDVLPAGERRRWINELAAEPATRAMAVRGLGMIGDRAALPWLVRRMSDRSVAALAADAFLEIFGPVPDQDDYFYADADRAAEGLGVDADDVQGRIPIAAAFAALIDDERVSNPPLRSGSGRDTHHAAAIDATSRRS